MHPGKLLILAAAAALVARPVVAQCPDGSPSPCGRATARASAPPATSVAVLYFENTSRDTTDAYIADGLTEEITARLGQVGRLVVTSRTGVRRLRESAATMSPTDLGRALNTAYLVNGTVRRAGSRLRVTVELLRAATGVQAWSSQYDRSTEDLLGIQEEIAIAVANAIAGRLLPDERARLESRPTTNPAAYDLYLRARRAFSFQTLEALEEAIAALQAALRLDPTFTTARGLIAYAYGWAMNWDQPIAGVPPDSMVARGLAAADAALREDSMSADAWTGRGWLLFFRDPPDFSSALAALRRAVRLDSTSQLAHLNLASAVRRLGDYDAGEAELRRALGPGPERAQAMADLGFVSFSRRRFAEARARYDTAITLNPRAWSHFNNRARARLMLGDTAGALEDAQEAGRVSPVSMRIRNLAVLAQIEAASGNVAGARARLDPVVASLAAGEGPVTVRIGWELAAALTALGDTDRAIGVLERVRPRGPWLWSYLVFPDFDRLRADPRFQRIFAAAAPPGAPPVPPH
jgi:TolB-like protein/Tfp pilus assembly protein PilF